MSVFSIPYSLLPLYICGLAFKKELHSQALWLFSQNILTRTLHSLGQMEAFHPNFVPVSPAEPVFIQRPGKSNCSLWCWMQPFTLLLFSQLSVEYSVHNYIFKHSQQVWTSPQSECFSFVLLEEPGSKNRALLCILQTVCMLMGLSPSDAACVRRRRRVSVCTLSFLYVWRGESMILCFMCGYR